MSPQKGRTSLVVQWLRFHAPNAGGLGLIPGGTRSCVCVRVCELLSRVQLFVTPCTVYHQAPLSMEFSRQEYWSG